MDPSHTLAKLWHLGGLSVDALTYAQFSGKDPILPSSFAIATAAQSTIAAAALAACEVGFARGQARQVVAIDAQHAALECSGWFSVNGIVPEAWDQFSGLYPCADGWVRLHTNFIHHREGALDLLGLNAGTANKEAVRAALAHWCAIDFEDAAAERGLVVSALRSFETWDLHPQALAIAGQPLLTFDRIGDAPTRSLPALAPEDRPLTGIRVVDQTRIIAGPVGGRTLAAYGADVMLINAPHLPNIDAIMESSRGKLSAQLDLRDRADRQTLDALLDETHVVLQGYRPGGLDQLGCGPAQLVGRHPGLIVVSLSAYGNQGPWANRRGFDSLVQTATGFNHAEGLAFGTDLPKPLPVQILDFATGFLMAFGASVALCRQRQFGGSWHVQVSLAQTAHWLRGLGRVAEGTSAQSPLPAPYTERSRSGYGDLVAMRHAAQFSRTPAHFARPSMPPGSHTPRWPTR